MRGMSVGRKDFQKFHLRRLQLVLYLVDQEELPADAAFPVLEPVPFNT